VTREIALVIVLILLALALYAARAGWLTRVRKYQHLPSLIEGSLAGGVIDEFHVFYVSTAEADSPLERVARPPLGFRGNAHLVVREDGVEIALPGEPTALISGADIVGVGVATWTIDKSVEQDGLIVLRWNWGSLPVESFFRAVDYPRDSVIEALQKVIPSTQESGVS
jgi:hypothetical protein